jgi:hypothetical protein
VIKAAVNDDDTLVLAGESQNGPWPVRAVRMVPQQVPARVACFDYSVASVVEEPYTATERLPDGSERTTSFEFTPIGSSPSIHGSTHRR